MKLQLKLNKKYSLGVMLTVLFLVLILGEAYLLYFDVYLKLSPGEGSVATTSVVRVNLTQYDETIKLLNDYESYYPAPTFVDKNPFK